MARAREDDRLMKGVDVAKELGVTTRTVRRWANSKRLTTVRTIGGHRRYLANEVSQLSQKGEEPTS